MGVVYPDQNVRNDIVSIHGSEVVGNGSNVECCGTNPCYDIGIALLWLSTNCISTNRKTTPNGASKRVGYFALC